MKTPQEVKFYADHVYSAAPEAAAKEKIDLDFIGHDFSRGGDVRIDNAPYLRYLIDKASGGKVTVGAGGTKQFFIIRGGAEGFLPKSLGGVDASNVVETSGVTTAGAKKMTFRFDNNDLLAVFDNAGGLISSARLERPLFITGMWTQKTADKVYNSWAGKEVFIYRNDRFDIPYLGLGVADGFRGNKATVDLHKQEATNGCIFIVDPNTPPYEDNPLGKAKLGKFEPKLITDILSHSGIDPLNVRTKHISLGVMQVVEIR